MMNSKSCISNVQVKGQQFNRYIPDWCRVAAWSSRGPDAINTNTGSLQLVGRAGGDQMREVREKNTRRTLQICHDAEIAA
jgi:hypothetical protein